MQSPHKKILIIKLGAFGDFVQAFGVMRAIRKAHPTAFISLLTTSPFVDLALSSGYVDECHIDVRPKWYELKAWVDLSRWLNVSSFERVYDLQNNDRTSLYFKLFYHRPEWVGVAKGASHRNTSPQRVRGHGFDGHVQTMALANITGVEVDDLSWMDADLSRFNLQNPYVLLVPGSAPEHAEKRWPAKYYGELAGKLWGKYNLRPVLIGTSSEKDVIRKIIEICPEVLDLSGQTQIRDLPALARNAVAALGNDTGPMHVIGPTGVPSLVLFSSVSNPVRHKPLGKNVFALQDDKLDDLSVNKVMDEFYSRLLKAAHA
jgi:ADP-heptose:LPS heptosyltransferase